MRIVGVALLSAWMIAWWAAPHGEPARATVLVGGVAITGGDRPAVAWLELKHGQVNQAGSLHAAALDEHDRILDELSVYAGSDAVTFRLADAGGGRFVLAAEYRNEQGRWFEFHRFGAGSRDRPDDLKATFDMSAWTVSAAGDQLVVTEEVGGDTVLHARSETGRWIEPTPRGQVLVGAGGGQIITYAIGARQDEVVTLTPGGGWRTDVTDHPTCIARKSEPQTHGIVTCPQGAACPSVWEHAQREIDRAPIVVSVVPLRGGYARLARRGADACVDGLRDGRRFTIRDMQLKGYAVPRLSVDEDGRLAVYDQGDGKGTLRRRLLDTDGGSERSVDLSASARRLDEGLRYRLVSPGGTQAITALATLTLDHETQVAVQRYPLSGAAPSELVLAPARLYHPDHRPLLRKFSLAPLFALAFAALAAFRVRRRFARLAITPSDSALPAGRIAIEGTLATSADAPSGGLRVRRGGGQLTLFIEGADVVRGSHVRPRDEPRGDAVDVASGSPIIATGTITHGTMFRGDDVLSAGPGDLVVVGCTLAEARRRLTMRLASAVSMFAAAATLVGWLCYAG